MARLLEGKTAAITGGVTGIFTNVLYLITNNADTFSTGIGRAIVLEYARQGASIGVNYFPDDKSTLQFESLVAEAGDSGSKIIGVPGDIRKPESGQDLIAKTVEKFGRLDVFVSNAGVCEFADFLT
jgi:L-rhamnose 1-dehydrogenase